jgi:DNA-binding MarR family transcriptional regulator
LKYLPVKNLDVEILCTRSLDVKILYNYYFDVQKDRIDRFLESLDGIPDLDYDVEGIVDRISALQKRFQRDLEQTLAERGLTWGEWKVMGSLWHEANDNYCSSPGELAAELELSSGAMTNRLDKLEQRGFVRRRPDPDDRRGVRVELTEAGQRAWVDSTNAQARKEALVAAALSKREQGQLNGLLRKLMLAFESDRARKGAAADDPVGAIAEPRP